MNSSFFLLALLPVCLIPFAYAETYRGDTFEDTELYGTTHIWTGGLSPWLDTGTLDSEGRKVYTHYIVNDQPTYVEVSNGEASFIFDKLTCSAKIFDGGFITDGNNFILGSDSYTPKSSVNGTNTWSVVTSVDNAPCVTQIIEDTDSIEVSGTKTSAAGVFKIRYVKEINKPLKTILEATNLTALTDRQFGITQTQNVPRIINWGGSEKDLGDYVGTTFDRIFLENNKANLFKYSSKLNFNVIDAWNNLESIKVNSVDANTASISFNYLRNAPILLPEETLVIDPTYGYVTDTFTGFESNTSGAGGCNSYRITTTSDIVGSDNIYCYKSVSEFSIASIIDYSTITNVNLKYDTASAVGAPACNAVSISAQPSVTSDSSDFTNISSGSVYAAITCTGSNTDLILDLGASADSEVESRLTNGDWFAVGFRKNPDSYSNNYGEIKDLQLEVTYSIGAPRFEVSSFVENVGDAVSINGNVSISCCLLANLTSIVFYVDGIITNTNSTGQNYTSYPATINFGSFYNQQTTDSIYNYTFVAVVQQGHITYTNSTSNLVTREYDPDYFTAIDPTQGLVNYTFDDSNFLKVNRDTSGSLFNVECRFFTQAQAFQNQLSEGTWDNQTNVLFYVSDTSGFYYLECFNDGELFITAIQQNFTNGLVPGLIIFDQLGGFFGAPSIILVILSILSLGTGRNYPIIMLIAASVTGILLALGLLTLDPGLVVAIIVMTGFGLFGIRKFY
jgi:hypothetical protein